MGPAALDGNHGALPSWRQAAGPGPAAAFSAVSVVLLPMSRRSAPALLHHLDALLTLASPRPGAQPAGAPERRRRQRLALARRLIDPLPEALRPDGHRAELFWQALRWGGLGMALALFLRR